MASAPISRCNDSDLPSQARLKRRASPIKSTPRDRDLGSEVRQRALRWVNRAAEREGMVDRADRVVRELVLANGDNVEVRERALRCRFGKGSSGP